jgi:hypothetical protein
MNALSPQINPFLISLFKPFKIIVVNLLGEKITVII